MSIPHNYSFNFCCNAAVYPNAIGCAAGAPLAEVSGQNGGCLSEASSAVLANKAVKGRRAAKA